MKERRIFLRKTTLIWGIALCIVYMIMGSSITSLIALKIIPTRTDFDRIACSTIMSILTLAYLAAFLSCLPRIYTYICLTENGIEYKKAFHQKYIIKYTTFRYVYLGRYFHKGILPFGYFKIFIVLSQVYISPSQLNHVNTIKPSAETIVIEYKDETLDYLRKVLPYKQKGMLDKISLLKGKTGGGSLSRDTGDGSL